MKQKTGKPITQLVSDALNIYKDIINYYDTNQKIVSRNLARGNAKRVSSSTVRILFTARFTGKRSALIARTRFAFTTSKRGTPGNRYFSGAYFCKESRVY